MKVLRCFSLACRVIDFDPLNLKQFWNGSLQLTPWFSYYKTRVPKLCTPRHISIFFTPTFWFWSQSASELPKHLKIDVCVGRGGLSKLISFLGIKFPKKSFTHRSQIWKRKYSPIYEGLHVDFPKVFIIVVWSRNDLFMGNQVLGKFVLTIKIDHHPKKFSTPV